MSALGRLPFSGPVTQRNHIAGLGKAKTQGKREGVGKKQEISTTDVFIVFLILKVGGGRSDGEREESGYFLYTYVSAGRSLGAFALGRQ